MRWLFRFIQLALRSVLAILVWVLVFLFRLLVPYLLAVLRFLVSLMTTSIAAAVHGPRQYTEWLASKWAWQLLESGVSRDYLDQIYSLCRVLVVSKIVMGLAFGILFTLAILRVVFGIFT